jgi:hypothetical protein
MIYYVVEAFADGKTNRDGISIYVGGLTDIYGT